MLLKPSRPDFAAALHLLVAVGVGLDMETTAVASDDVGPLPPAIGPEVLQFVVFLESTALSVVIRTDLLHIHLSLFLNQSSRPDLAAALHLLVAIGVGLHMETTAVARDNV